MRIGRNTFAKFCYITGYGLTLKQIETKIIKKITYKLYLLTKILKNQSFKKLINCICISCRIVLK